MSLDPSEKPKQSDASSKKRVTLRDIGRELGISHVTVSKALRNQSGASPELKARIHKKATEMGYSPDPMLSALSRYRETNKDMRIQSELAWINTWKEPKKLREHKEFDQYWEGASYSAQRFGYHLEPFYLDEMPVKRLESILKARNIQGILLPPLGAQAIELKDFDWASFSVVRFGYSTPQIKSHFVTSAQMVNTMRAFDRANELGYKRIGFVCEYWQMRFFGVGYTWAQKTLPSEQQLPLLILNQSDDLSVQQEAMEKWLGEAKPDAILTDNNVIPEMLRNLGYRIPQDIGVATTSIHDTEIDAGIDQRPFEIGRAAIRIITALIVERSFGLPDCINETLIEGQWTDGSMLPPKL